MVNAQFVVQAITLVVAAALNVWRAVIHALRQLLALVAKQAFILQALVVLIQLAPPARTSVFRA